MTLDAKELKSLQEQQGSEYSLYILLQYAYEFKGYLYFLNQKLLKEKE